MCSGWDIAPIKVSSITDHYATDNKHILVCELDQIAGILLQYNVNKYEFAKIRSGHIHQLLMKNEN